jgi:hypothetical protein
MATNEKMEAARLGVRDAWDHFLADRLISSWECMEGGCKTAVAEFLERHKDEVIAAIAKAAAEKK